MKVEIVKLPGLFFRLFVPAAKCQRLTASAFLEKKLFAIALEVMAKEIR